MASLNNVTVAVESLSDIDVRSNEALTLLESDDMRPTLGSAQQHPINNTILLPNWSAHRMKKFILIWLDPNLDESNGDYQNSIDQLRQIVSSTKIFNDVEQCIDFIMEIEAAKIFLILVGTIGETIVPVIHEALQLESIYLLCENKTKHEERILEWTKVEGIFTNISSICDQLQRNIKQCKQDFIPTNMILSSTGLDLNELDQSFMYSQLLTEILREMNYEATAKEGFIQLCREHYYDNKVQLSTINDFERDYKLHSPLWWYIKRAFIWSMLASPLRTQNIPLIIKMGFYIKDLHEQIKQIHSATKKSEKMTVYRGQVMANAEFEKLRQNEGCLLSFNSFLSTTTASEEALLYADSAAADPQLTRIIFEIEVDPSTSTIPFVSLSDVSDIPFCENEVLFSMHTVFRIGAIDQITDRLWSVNLTSTSDTDHELQRLSERLRKEIQGPNSLHRLGKLLIKMGEFGKAEEIFKALFDTTSNVDMEQVASFYNEFGCICKEKADFSKALFYHKKALESQMKVSQPNQSLLANIYNDIGEVHRLNGAYAIALSYYQKSLDVNQQAVWSKHPELATTYNNISQVYISMGNYSDALSYLQKTLEIQEQNLPRNHPDLAITYNNIGQLYNLMGEYPMALSKLQKTLEIQEKSLPPSHPHIGATYNSIGQLHMSMGEYSTALSDYEKSFEIFQKTLPPNHPDLAATQNNIGRVHFAMKNYLSALPLYEKSLEIYRKILPSDHPELAATHNDIGRVYDSIKDYPTAKKYYEQALKMYRNVLPANHPDLAATYDNIGRVHYALGEYSIALSYDEETLKIQQISLPSNHPLLATTHNHIGHVYYAMKDYPTTLSHYQKALEIQLKSLTPNHPYLAMTYNYMGTVYLEMNDCLSAVPYYKKTLKIQQITLPTNHPSLAITHTHIAHAHELGERYSDALDHYQYALQIQQKTLSIDHPSLGITYFKIGEMHRSTGNYVSALHSHEKTLEIRTKSLPPNHSSLAESHYHIALVLEGFHRYKETIEHASRALNIARHSSDLNQSQIEKYHQFVDQVLLIPECSELVKTNNINKWTYPVLLILQSSHQSRLHSILYELTDGHLMPPCLEHDSLAVLESNKELRNLVLEISTPPSADQDRLLNRCLSIDHIESIYLLGKSPEPIELRTAFFTRFYKVSMFCEDEEQLLVRWALATANIFRVLGGQCAEANENVLAHEYFQRGIELYDHLGKLIDEKVSQVLIP